VADCVPILVGDVISGRAAAIHAGWRGIEAGVIGAALATLGDSRSVRVAAIGPCIGACCFEVGIDVAERLVRATDATEIVADSCGGKARVDLRRAARAQLEAHGFLEGSIDDVGGCTKCDAERFFSFRRSGEASGRHLAVIRARG
jgi:YfiH family protein